MDRQIRVVQKEGAYPWAVFYQPTEGPEVYDDQLTFDEALGVVAAILLGMEPRYLRSAEQWKQYNEAREARLQQIRETSGEKP
jgi:hypothetical protein